MKKNSVVALSLLSIGLVFGAQAGLSYKNPMITITNNSDMDMERVNIHLLFKQGSDSHNGYLDVLDLLKGESRNVQATDATRDKCSYKDNTKKNCGPLVKPFKKRDTKVGQSKAFIFVRDIKAGPKNHMNNARRDWVTSNNLNGIRAARYVITGQGGKYDIKPLSMKTKTPPEMIVTE